MAGYNKVTRSYFKMVLLGKKKEVIARSQSNGHSVYKKELDEAEWTERPQIMERHNVLANGYQEQLREIETALRKCEDGTYGLCPDCKTLIPYDRLEASPADPRCVTCHIRHRSGGKTKTSSLSPAMH